MIPTAGNYGWPYCMGNQQAYRDRVADGSLRTMNGPGFVNGGPAGNQTPGWYDCKNLVNDSTNNTGLVTLPHTTGTGKDAGTARSHNIWWSRGNLNGANGCPEFPRANADSAPDYGAQPTQLCPYVISAGLTVFAGPVYRYDDKATDNAARWPEYWDGRWFLQDYGNTSVKHAPALRPKTARTASSRSTPTRSAAGSSGAPTTWTPSSEPTARCTSRSTRASSAPVVNAGMFKLSYTGGADTPRPTRSGPRPRPRVRSSSRPAPRAA